MTRAFLSGFSRTVSALAVAPIVLLCALAAVSGASAASWSVVHYPGEGGLPLWLSAVSCTARTDCEAVGSQDVSRARSLAVAERWNGSHWRRQRIPLPAGARTTGLSSVSCSSRSACTAVGYSYRQHPARVTPLIARWDGSHWSLQTSGRLTPPGGKSQQSELVAVSCVSARWCMAIGQYGEGSAARPVAERWTRSSWKLQPIAGPGGAADSQLASVSCTSSDACVAVGTAGVRSEGDMALAESWDGSGWSTGSPPTPASAINSGLAAVSCPSADSCEAVGSAPVDSSLDQALTEGTSGTAWSLQPTPIQPFASMTQLDSIACPSTGACEAVGIYQDSLTGDIGPLAGRWDGSQWSLALLPIPPQRHARLLSAVSCVSADWCLAVGENLVERYS